MVSVLRMPAITSGPLPTFAVDQPFPGYEITATNGSTAGGTPGLPDGLYSSVQNLPDGLAVNAATGQILQTGPVVAGKYDNIILQAQNFVGTGSKTVSLVVQPASAGPATTWMQEKGLSGANFAAVANQDDDGDGLNNTVEYTFGLDPLKSDQGAFVRQLGAGSLVLEWNALKTGATYSVQQNASANLATWQNLISPSPEQITGGDARYQRWRITIPISGSSSFYRLRAELAPGTLD